MGEIIGDESLPLRGKATGNQHGAQRLLVTELVQSGAQCPELLPDRWRRGGVEKGIPLKVDSPAWIGAPAPDVVEAQELAGSQATVDLGMDKRVEHWGWWRKRNHRWFRGDRLWRRDCRPCTRTDREGSFLFCSFQCFVDPTHGFLSPASLRIVLVRPISWSK